MSYLVNIQFKSYRHKVYPIPWFYYICGTLK